VALTPAGTARLEEARLTLARAAEAVEHARRADRGEVGRLAIGFLPATTYTLLPLVLRPPVSEAELASEILLEEPFVLALPAAHPLATLRRVPAKRLAGEAFVMFPRVSGHVFHDQIVGFCLRAGFTPHVAQEVRQIHTVLGLVSAGIGVALVPASAGSMGLAGVVYRPLREATPLACTALAWRLDATSPVVTTFVDTARRVAKQFAARTV